MGRRFDRENKFKTPVAKAVIRLFCDPVVVHCLFVVAPIVLRFILSPLSVVWFLVHFLVQHSPFCLSLEFCKLSW